METKNNQTKNYLCTIFLEEHNCGINNPRDLSFFLINNIQHINDIIFNIILISRIRENLRYLNKRKCRCLQRLHLISGCDKLQLQIAGGVRALLRQRRFEFRLGRRDETQIRSLPARYRLS